MGESPPIFGPGWDFFTFWQTGQTILAGGNPYGGFPYGSNYPPVTTLLFVVLALVPLNLSFAIWTGFNVVAVVAAAGPRKALGWVIYFPVLMAIAAGQIDLLLVAAATMLSKKDWRSIVAAVAITLKPQCAFLILPIWLIRWALTDRRRLAIFAGSAAVVHTLPLIAAPWMMGAWFQRALGYDGANPGGSAPGIWSVQSVLGAPAWPFVVISIMAVAAGLLSGRDGASRAANLIALPTGHPYNGAVLLGTAPVWLMVALSWIAAAAAHAVGAYWPFAILPGVVLALDYSRAHSGSGSRGPAKSSGWAIPGMKADSR